VLNAGRHGDTTADALARIDRDVLDHDPRLVIVEFGGNDFRKRVDKEETFRNLDEIVGRISRHGAMVVLLEIRIGLLRDEYLGGYRRVAEAHGALLIADFMSGILGSARLTVDGLHPNAEGHQLIAERVLKEVVPVLEAAEALRARSARRLDFTASLR
jgi:acyl-CoA thioesterase-1